MTRKLKATLARADAALALDWFDIVALHGELKGALRGLAEEVRLMLPAVDRAGRVLAKLESLRVTADEIEAACKEARPGTLSEAIVTTAAGTMADLLREDCKDASVEERAVAFVREVLIEWDQQYGDLDGGWIQEVAEKHGFYRTVPAGTHTECENCEDGADPCGEVVIP